MLLDRIQVPKSEEDDAAWSSRHIAAEGAVGKMGSKSHTNRGAWQRHVDNAFARNFYDQNEAPEDWQREPSWLC